MRQGARFDGMCSRAEALQEQGAGRPATYEALRKAGELLQKAELSLRSAAFPTPYAKLTHAGRLDAHSKVSQVLE